MLRRATRYLVVHCSATQPSMDIGVAEIRKWHVEERLWRDVGYHFVVRRDGTVEPGRHVAEVGSHVVGYNMDSVGICLVGGVDAHQAPENNFTDAQFAALADLLLALKRQYPIARIRGHRDFPNVPKACPSFDVKAWCVAQGLT